MKRALKVLLVVLLLLVVGALGGVGMIWVMQMPFVLAFGWVKYLRTTLPNVPVNLPLIAAALGCLVAATGLFHALAKSLSGGAKPWRWRWTFLWMSLILAMFAIGAAAIGVVHQTTWLATMPEKIAQTDPRWRVMTGLSRLNGEAMNFAMREDRLPTAAELEARVADDVRWNDPWGTRYRYTLTPDGSTAELRSAGDDKEFGTDDDVVRSLTPPSSTP